MGALAAALDALVDYRQGTAASRPANPGHQAVLHWATDTLKMSYWDGTTWYQIGPSTTGADSVTAVEIAANAVGSSELADNAVDINAIQDGAVTTNKHADASVTAVKIAAALKPSGGAGAATESLRALGTAAGTAAAGTHGSQHATAGADPLPANSVGATQITDGSVTLAKLAAMITNAQSGSYTLALADRGKMVEVSNAGGVNLTVPPNSSVPFTVGDSVNIMQTGAGLVTVVQGGGVTVNANPGLKLGGQWAVATLLKRATDSWVLMGNISA
jgi:hypothetical protein